MGQGERENRGKREIEKERDIEKEREIEKKRRVGINKEIVQGSSTESYHIRKHY